MDMSVKLSASYPQVATQATAASAAAPAVPAASTATATATSDTSSTQEPSREELDKAVKDLQDHADSTQRGLRFSIDDTTHQVVVKIIATDSGEVVRQLPTEAALKLARYLKETDSMLLDTQV